MVYTMAITTPSHTAFSTIPALCWVPAVNIRRRLSSEHERVVWLCKKTIVVITNVMHSDTSVMVDRELICRIVFIYTTQNTLYTSLHSHMI